jgi:UDP-N-acetylglucosamine 1-carboxyvinyltransferase
MAAEKMGAKREGNRLLSNGLKGAKIYLPKPSVGATINAAIMAASASGETEIFGYAKEPHVLAVLNFLIAIGASVSILENSIKIKSAPPRGAEVSVIGDMIEAGTYIILGLVSGGSVEVSGIVPGELSSFLDALTLMGYAPKTRNSSIFVDSRYKTEAEIQNIQINATPYPGFPTDLQPLIVPLLAKISGTVKDSVWQERFGYLVSLGKMGLDYDILKDSVKIRKSHLHSATVTAPDLRGGMALLIAALGAEGTSEIFSPEIILRGYDHLIEKLSSLGAKVKITNM